jgi:hypothetical protein
MSGVIDAGSERRNVSDDLLEKWSLAPASFLNLTYAIRKPLNGLAYAKPSKVFTFATSLENLT